MERLNKLDPVLLRAFLLALAALLSSAGFTFFTEENVGLIVGIIVAVVSLVQGFVTRPTVTPNAKVIAYTSDPDKPVTSKILPGEATVPEYKLDEVVAAATIEGS